MKPISLELAGFGPYRARQRVNFSELESLFVVSGETGSGKTSLFDALSYALYGKLLGVRDSVDTKSQDKISHSLRCDLCDESEPTEVTLEFEVAGVAWRVHRAPYAPRAKKRGSGWLNEQKVSLERRDAEGQWQGYGGKGTATDINNYIEHEILHLSHANFAKILVLPQGEFQKFLEDTSNARSQLLTKLFPVQEQLALTQAAKESAKDAKERSEQAYAESIQHLRELLPDPDEQRVEQLSQPAREEALASGATALSEAHKNAAARAGESDVALKAAQAALTAGQQLRAQVQEREAKAGARQKLLDAKPAVEAAKAELDQARRANRVLAAVHAETMSKTRLKTNAEELQQATEALAQATKERTALQPRYDQLDSLKSQQLKANNTLNELERRGKQLGRWVTLRASAAQASAAVDAAAANEERLTEALTAATAALTDLEASERRREALRAPLEQAQAALSQLTSLTDKAKTSRAFEAEVAPAYEAQRPKLEAETKSCEEALERARAAERALTERFATAKLAEALADDAPCPVCGSTDHPSPASHQPWEDAPLTQLEDAAARVKEATRALELSQKLLTSAETNFGLQQQLVTAAKQALQASGHPSVEAWQAALQAAEETLKGLRAQELTLRETLANKPQLLKSREGAEARLATGRAATTQAKATLAARRGQIDELRAEIGEVDAPQEALEQSRRDFEQAREQLRSTDSEIQEITRLWQEVVEKISSNEALVKDKTERAETLTEALNAASGALTEALEQQQFQDADQAKAAARDAAREQELERYVTDWAQRVSALDERLAELKELIGERRPPDLEALTAATALAEAAQITAKEAEAQAKVAVDQFVARRGRYEEALARYRSFISGSEGLLKLSETVDGKNSKNLKFSDWVLGWWLDRVLTQANLRLHKLSDGRYELRRRFGDGDGRKSAGLDLNVLDAHSGKQRDVRTLSGGEKFLASISLALGLADVIQSQSGAVRLDTLFIDEGFGTLSPEYRDVVLQTLDELGGSRQVGVISHVDEVKAFIPCQVAVTKTTSGSTVSLRA